jgi:hypothetical protein
MGNTNLTLGMRHAKIGASVNTRTEKHGDDDVPACDIPLEGLMLEAGELDALLGAGAHKALFTKSKDLHEPKFSMLKALALADKFEDACVIVELADESTLEVACRIKGVKLEPQTGGLTSCDLQMQATPTAEDMALVFAHLNAEVRAEVRFGKRAVKGKKQPELPMGSHSQASDDDADETRTAH